MISHGSSPALDSERVVGPMAPEVSEPSGHNLLGTSSMDVSSTLENTSEVELDVNSTMQTNIEQEQELPSLKATSVTLALPPSSSMAALECSVGKVGLEEVVHDILVASNMPLPTSPNLPLPVEVPMPAEIVRHDELSKDASILPPRVAELREEKAPMIVPSEEGEAMVVESFFGSLHDIKSASTDAHAVVSLESFWIRMSTHSLFMKAQVRLRHPKATRYFQGGNDSKQSHLNPTSIHHQPEMDNAETVRVENDQLKMESSNATKTTSEENEVPLVSTPLQTSPNGENENEDVEDKPIPSIETVTGHSLTRIDVAVEPEPEVAPSAESIESKPDVDEGHYYNEEVVEEVGHDEVLQPHQTELQARIEANNSVPSQNTSNDTKPSLKSKKSVLEELEQSLRPYTSPELPPGLQAVPQNEDGENAHYEDDYYEEDKKGCYEEDEEGYYEEDESEEIHKEYEEAPPSQPAATEWQETVETHPRPSEYNVAVNEWGEPDLSKKLQPMQEVQAASSTVDEWLSDSQRPANDAWGSKQVSSADTQAAKGKLLAYDQGAESYSGEWDTGNARGPTNNFRSQEHQEKGPMESSQWQTDRSTNSQRAGNYGRSAYEHKAISHGRQVELDFSNDSRGHPGTRFEPGNVYGEEEGRRGYESYGNGQSQPNRPYKRVPPIPTGSEFAPPSARSTFDKYFSDLLGSERDTDGFEPLRSGPSYGRLRESVTMVPPRKIDYVAPIQEQNDTRMETSGLSKHGIVGASNVKRYEPQRREQSFGIAGMASVSQPSTSNSQVRPQPPNFGAKQQMMYTYEPLKSEEAPAKYERERFDNIGASQFKENVQEWAKSRGASGRNYEWEDNQFEQSGSHAWEERPLEQSGKQSWEETPAARQTTRARDEKIHTKNEKPVVHAWEQPQLEDMKIRLAMKPVWEQSVKSLEPVKHAWEMPSQAKAAVAAPRHTWEVPQLAQPTKNTEFRHAWETKSPPSYAQGRNFGQPPYRTEHTQIAQEQEQEDDDGEVNNPHITLEELKAIGRGYTDDGPNRKDPVEFCEDYAKNRNMVVTIDGELVVVSREGYQSRKFK